MPFPSSSFLVFCKCVFSVGWLRSIFNAVYSAVALSAVSGQVLWTHFMQESVMYIQCGLQYGNQHTPVVLLISKSLIVAVNGTSG